MKEMAAIPCLFLRNPTESTKIIIYFHGNAEDLGGTSFFLKMIQAEYNAHIIAVEYPSYGVYEGQVNEEAVCRDAKRVVEFTKAILRWKTQDLIIMGRSIGSGPAWYLAAEYDVGALVLISPHTSIRGVVKWMFFSLSQYFIKERFKNYEMVAKAQWPTFILHGEKDNVIPVDHARSLSELWGGPTCLVVSETMDHSSFNFESELMNPLKEFLSQHGIETKPKETSRTKASGFLCSRPYFSYLKGPNRNFESNEISRKAFSTLSKIIPLRETVIGHDISDDDLSSTNTSPSKVNTVMCIPCVPCQSSSLWTDCQQHTWECKMSSPERSSHDQEVITVEIPN